MNPLGNRAVVTVKLPVHNLQGHEQEGYRPAVIVGVPDALGTPRYPMVLIVPLSTQIRPWVKQTPKLYPVLKTGMGGLTADSVALLDNLRAIDANQKLEQSHQSAVQADPGGSGR